MPRSSLALSVDGVPVPAPPRARRSSPTRRSATAIEAERWRELAGARQRTIRALRAEVERLELEAAQREILRSAAERSARSEAAAAAGSGRAAEQQREAAEAALAAADAQRKQAEAERDALVVERDAFRRAAEDAAARFESLVHEKDVWQTQAAQLRRELEEEKSLAAELVAERDAQRRGLSLPAPPAPRDNHGEEAASLRRRAALAENLVSSTEAANRELERELAAAVARAEAAEADLAAARQRGGARDRPGADGAHWTRVAAEAEVRAADAEERAAAAAAALAAVRNHPPSPSHNWSAVLEQGLPSSPLALPGSPRSSVSASGSFVSASGSFSLPPNSPSPPRPRAFRYEDFEDYR